MSDSDAERGRRSFEWARRNMPAFRLAETYVRNSLRKKRSTSFRELRLAACLHVSKETAVLIQSLHSLGLEVNLVAANPLSSQTDIAAFLSTQGIEVIAKRGETVGEYESAILSAARCGPNLIVDDGGELHVAYSTTNLRSCFGGTDETTSGTTRLRSLSRKRKLRYPVIPINDAKTKHIFDNKFGTGQSAIDGLLRATGLLVAGKVLVIAGFGWVGSGVALRARGMGARIIVTEIDPTRALEAHLNGFDVLPMESAAEIGEIFLTCTGQVNVISSDHFRKMKDGTIVGNVGHFDQEIDVKALFRLASKVEQVRESIAKFQLREGRASKAIFLLNQGRVVNLASAEGHPPEVMQLSFANQLLSLFYLVDNKKRLRRAKEKVIQFPKEIDDLVARFALQAFDLKIDTLTERQVRYASSFNRL